MMKNKTNKKRLGIFPTKYRYFFCMLLFFLLTAISVQGKNLPHSSKAIKDSAVATNEFSEKSKIYILGDSFITDLNKNDTYEIIVVKQLQKKKQIPQKKTPGKLKKEAPKKQHIPNTSTTDDKKFIVSPDSRISFSGKLSLKFVGGDYGGSGKPLFTKIQKKHIEIPPIPQSDIVPTISLSCISYDFFVDFHTVRPPPFSI